MEDARILLKQAVTCRKDAAYKKAVTIYHNLWENDPAQFSEWDGWSYAYCLFKLKEYIIALTICRALYPRFPDFELLRSLYARCIFYTQFRQKIPPPLPTLTKAAKAILDLSPPYKPYSVAPQAVFELVKAGMQQTTIHWEELEDWLQQLDPDLLDDQAFKMADATGKSREIASAMEQWYALMIKVKAGLNKPAQLLELLAKARAKKLRWHYRNDIWFARKEAFAYQQLGQKEKAEKILRNILLRKKDWFLIFDLAKAVPNKQEALQLLCRAALSDGKTTMKLKLYESLYEALENNPALNRIALLHLCLIAAIREENGWEVKHTLPEKIRSGGIDINAQGASSLLLKQLSPFWEKTARKSAADGQKHEGIIAQIFPHGGAGLIKAKGVMYYFIAKGIKGAIKPGQKVSFEVIDSYDKKKNKPSKMAVRVIMMEGHPSTSSG